MQDYHEFMRELRAAIAGIGQPVTPAQADERLSPAQQKHRRGQNFMTTERVAYLNCAGGPEGFGPVIVEVSHGAFLDNRMIGLTVYHQIRDKAAHDFDASGAVHSVADARERLQQLDGGE